MSSDEEWMIGAGQYGGPKLTNRDSGSVRQRTSWTPVPEPSYVVGGGSLWVILDDPDAKMPEIQHAGDAGYDLTVSRVATVDPGTFTDVHCGIRLQLPSGTWGRLTGRSSALRKRGLLVNEAVLDNGYIGSIYVGVWNLTESSIVVQPGERIAQLILHPIVRVPVTQTDQPLRQRDGRGDGGFGSTGS